LPYLLLFWSHLLRKMALYVLKMPLRFSLLQKNSYICCVAHEFYDDFNVSDELKIEYYEQQNMNFKRTSGIVFVALTLLAMGCATSQQRAEQKIATQKAVTEALTNRHLRINVRSMNPFRYASRTVSYGFFLEIKGDTLESYLPYMGQAYQAAAFSSEGLNFEAPIVSYRETRAKKNMTSIELDVKTREDNYHYTLEIHDTGTAYIRVRCQNRDSISFDGDCEV